MKADVIKKHHYWLVFGASLLMVLLAYVMLGGASGAIEKETAEQKKAKDEANRTQAPGQVALEEIKKQKDLLEKKKDDLWKENWEAQKKFYTWPATADHLFDDYNALKFGEALKDYSDNKDDVFRRQTVYKAVYEQMAESIAPTKFAGGWASVLGERYIAVWGDKKAEPRQLWLALEDIWVQRALLDPIRLVNASVATFKITKDETPLKRTFESPVWQIALDIVPQGSGHRITARLKNRTNQMQLLGSGSTMILKIWLDKSMDLPPVEFKVEGEFVPGDADIAVPPLPSHVVPAGTSVTEIAKVEQVLDERTVPIREVAKIKLNFLPGRDANATKTMLLPPEFWKDDAAGDPANPNPMAGGGPGPGNPRGEGGPPPRGGDLGGFPGGVPGAGAAAGAVNATLKGAVDENRRRYTEVNAQLRRMPVAIKLVLDQRYMQDVMVAYTNSPLRLQLTQFHWARFRGTLSGSETTPSGGGGVLAGGGPTSDLGPAIQGMVGADLGPRGPRGGPGSEAAGALPPRGVMPGAPSGLPPGPGLPPFGPGPGGPAPIPGLVGGSLMNVSEAQANSSLIELYLFGIVTLYEKHDEKKDPNAPVTPGATAPATPGATVPTVPATPMETTPKPAEPAPMPITPAAPGTPVPTTPAPGTPMPMTPPPAAPTTPKL